MVISSLQNTWTLESTTQLSALASKAQQQTLLIATGALLRHGARLAYFGIYIPSLCYVLPQCHFAHSQLDKAETKTISTILAKCGFNRHTPQPIRCAPASFAGCGMIPWWVLQSEGQLLLFLKHWRTNTMISRTLRIAVAWAQWQTGLSNSFLFDVSTSLPHFEARWLKSLRVALDRASLKLHIHKTYVVPPERTNDQHIMEWVVEHSELLDHAIRIINYCRLYVHATTVSELFDESGLCILPHMYNCQRPPWFNKKQFMPLQVRPSAYQIKRIWKPFCCDRWIQKVAVSSQQYSLRKWISRAAHYHPYRTSYADNGPPPTTKFYKWHLDSFWKMELTPTTHSDWCLLSLKFPSVWRPTPSATPIHLIPAG